MIVLDVRNVHEALPRAVRLLQEVGIRRDSRNGSVLVAPEPVCTVYRQPCERVMFWPSRDANPFFHLYESLWMLAGRNDVEGVARYVNRMREFSDDGVTFHAAYGHRWIKHFGRDQITEIVRTLLYNKDDRRCVLQMWDPAVDLGRNGKDLPCNVSATFQVVRGDLSMTVFCRSNDIILGAYGANAVHFSMLQEYVAARVGVPVGTYNQISVNWHAYLNDQWNQLLETSFTQTSSYGRALYDNPYADGLVRPATWPVETAVSVIECLLYDSDSSFEAPRLESSDPWTESVTAVLRAHHVYKTTKSAERAIEILESQNQRIDWIAAARQWLERRIK